ncbi:predicted protein [Uncinocarpus reesii 1704]|uniref:Uncharacterized protein n=1 Tax=Uncinocarpus reesii (strain UAMH 1704) TaxID=336963 RepID=C4JT43_UNCRE|nr:uncharacterized protein UREG_05632 [Uncinocarpus reesii 1704]EEP80790.1 predicted protein [Uncinocarpus reesii 1704]
MTSSRAEEQFHTKSKAAKRLLSAICLTNPSISGSIISKKRNRSRGRDSDGSLPCDTEQEASNAGLQEVAKARDGWRVGTIVVVREAHVQTPTRDEAQETTRARATRGWGLSRRVIYDSPSHCWLPFQLSQAGRHQGLD